jgi:integrase
VSITEMRQILEYWGMRFQDPSIQKTRGKNPKYFIRPVVPQWTEQGIERRQKTITLGRCSEMTIKQAAREKQRVMAEINGGQTLITGQIRLRELIDRYRAAHLPTLATSTQGKYESHLRNHVSQLGGLALYEVTPDLLQSWLLGLSMNQTTRQDVKNLLSSMFEAARRWRLIDGGNPVRDVRIGRVAQVREKYLLTEAQIQSLRAALDCCGATGGGATGPEVRLLIDVILATGWRASEVLALQHDAICGEHLEVRRTWYRGELRATAKTAAGFRRNWVGAELAGELSGKSGQFIFGGEQPFDERGIQQHILRPCAESVGVYRPGFGLRLFRRENISWRQEAGATPAEVMRAAGHTRMDTTLLYTVVDAAREKSVVEKVRGRVQ